MADHENLLLEIEDDDIVTSRENASSNNDPVDGSSDFV